MGVHRERLAASRAHRSFVEGARAALQRLGCSVPIPSDISPVMVGAKLLPFAAPPMTEEAFGYRGALRFVEFGFSPRTRRFSHCDGGDDIPSDADTWLQFLHHPLVAPQLPESRYPTLYGVFRGKAQPSLQELMKRRDQRTECIEPVHCLVLDRETRGLYLSRRDQIILFFSLNEPEEKHNHRIFIDGLRLSPGDENYKDPPSHEVVEEHQIFLDDQLKIRDARARRSHV